MWPNRYYQTPEEETAHAPSRVSLATGVTASGFSLPELSPSPPEELREVPLPPPVLSELPELPGIAEYNRRVATLPQHIKAHNQRIRELPLTANQCLDGLLTCI